DLMKFGNMEELTGLRIRGNNIRLLLLFVQEQSEERAVNYREINRLLKRTKELANKMGLKSTTHYFTQQYTELVNQKQLWDDFIKKYY
ncbi:MAG: hypothetical protein ACTSSH_07600, partial [Candidatus Heimdallarchaeota archaeon]